MKILFEEYAYRFPYIQEIHLCPYFFFSDDGQEAWIPYVGYYFSQEINDSVFILPKVFLFEGEGDAGNGEIAFGKYRPEDIINPEGKDNPLMKDGFDNVVFNLSVWLYQAISRYQQRHPYSGIISDAKIQNVISRRGETAETYLDIVLSLLRFGRKHSGLFTYITILNSSGNDRIHWGKTVARVAPTLQGRTPLYMEFINRNRSVNYDEQLVVLFYSVLNYLHSAYRFPFRPVFNYPLLRPDRIASMIETGSGTRQLRAIRRKYFKDELVALWQILYAFFEKAESVACRNSCDEALLVHNFNMVFEDMIDDLIGDDIPEIRSLKDNRDGKRIDHIYEDSSLVRGSDIYFIGDSKYYSDSSTIHGESVYKQFTYAKNIIQYSMDIFNGKGSYPRNLRYRDELTEGYNITPNFFIRGSIRTDSIAGGKFDFQDDCLENEGKALPDNKHFRNRLFDRDTLILQSYNINFLYVLNAYAFGTSDTGFKEKARRRFRADVISEFNRRYDFYTVTPRKGMGLSDFVSRHFKLLNGKIYRASDADGFVYLALEHDLTSENLKILDVVGEDAVVERVRL